MADGLAGPVSQSSAIKPKLPVGVITSHVIVVSAQGLYYLYTTGNRNGVRARHAQLCVLTPAETVQVKALQKRDR
ncbi:hypothetical protein ElyMa_001892100 [Elysia marginata]|uniref:Uncharacterized protein n=1 Tax=Elysia marginata TaxID=1093978 RepID=A0AAV4ESD0_9GAST|nr:hypothetical protein ElyMa_001892100 [Elysia marginata]